VDNEADSDKRRRAAERRSRVQVRVIGLKDDQNAFDREYFAALSPGQKMTMIGTMFAEQWILTGGDAEQLRLRRHLARLERRGR
jgi:hypothetical protein